MEGNGREGSAKRNCPWAKLLIVQNDLEIVTGPI